MQEKDEDSEDDIDFLGSKTLTKFIDNIKRPFQDLFATPEPPVWDEADEYDFTHKSRGSMVIINNEFFKSHSARPGSNVDASNLERTFTQLGFEVFLFHNQTRDQMMKIFKKAAKSDHSSADCFACAILSHGDEVHVVDSQQPYRHEREDVVYAIDQVLLTKEILKKFTDRKCPTLAGKPKLFFIQACRGNTLDSGVNLTVLGGGDETDAVKNDHYEVSPCPIYKDYLVMYATPPGYYAFRRMDTGSWFVKALCEVLSRKDAEYHSLNKLLTAVIRLVAQEYQSKSANLKISGKKQTPCFASMLTKDVFFAVKESSPSE